MPSAVEFEKLLAQQIKHLREYTRHELAKREGLAAADVERFDAEQKAADEVFAKVVALNESIRQMGEALDAAGVAPGQADRLRKLSTLLQQARTAANQANVENQHLVKAVLRDMQTELRKIRAGRKALTAYEKDAPRDKPPPIVSGKL
jgi:hypothetical protein